MIGKKFFKYDCNLRVYTDPETGIRSPGAPIFKYSFREYWVVGQTTRSWMLSTHENAGTDHYTVVKVPKKDLFEEHGYLTEEMKDNSIWANDNRYRIEKEVSRASIHVLKKIDDVLKEHAR